MGLFTRSLEGIPDKIARLKKQGLTFKLLDKRSGLLHDLAEARDYKIEDSAYLLNELRILSSDINRLWNELRTRRWHATSKTDPDVYKRYESTIKQWDKEERDLMEMKRSWKRRLPKGTYQKIFG